MVVSEIMSRSVETVSPSATLKDVARVMLERSVGCLPVVDKDGAVIGIISESDFVGRMSAVQFSRETSHSLFGIWTKTPGIEKACAETAGFKVGDFMQTPVITVGPNDTVDEAVDRMLKNRIRRLPVVKGGKPVGILCRKDLLKIFL